MRRLLMLTTRGSLCLALTLGAIACVSPSAPEALTSTTGGLTGVAGEVFGLTNRERVAAGLQPLRADARLTQAAQLQADQMAAVGQLGHTLPSARYPRLEDRLAAAQYRWTLADENLGVNQPTAAAVVESWMRSPEHRSVILTPGYVDIGVARTADAGGRVYYVQVFARP